jgi:hypothetical protein
MKLACWHFGGQEITGQPTRSFLSEESLFLLIWRPRRGDMESRIIQWLTSIQTHAPGSPILVVANQFEGDTPADLDHQQLQNDFPAIVGFFQLNAATKVGVPELIEAVRAAAGDLPLMGKPWPRSWHKAANAVRQHDEPYMSARTFENYLEKQGLITGTRAQRRCTPCTFWGIPCSFRMTPSSRIRSS